MVVTTRVRLDRILVHPQRALAPEVIVGDEIVAAEGYVLAVRILDDKSTYNTVEDLTGRMVSLRAGDVLAGMLGTRRALRGYAGVVPATSSPWATRSRCSTSAASWAAAPRSIPRSARRSRPRCWARSSRFPELGDRVGRPAHIRDRAVPAGGLPRERGCRWSTWPAPA